MISSPRAAFAIAAFVAALVTPGALADSTPVGPYTVERVYTPDFVLPNGRIFEVKGWFTPADRTKMLAVKKAHPSADIRMVLACPDKRLTKSRRGLTEATWCDKFGFPWCSGGVPDAWLV